MACIDRADYRMALAAALDWRHVWPLRPLRTKQAGATMDAPYQVVYDVALQDACIWPNLLVWVGLGALMVLALIALNKVSEAPAASSYIERNKLQTFVILFAALLFVVIGYALNNQARRVLADAERSGAATSVDGVVTNFVPWPNAPHKMERFCVADSCFEYSDFVSTGGFNQTSAKGGPIRDGLHVRLLHVGGLIVRLEVQP
jgi:hypothetical protein